jgi:hypothetical protein
MAVKTWSTGELLTNVDANTYAANSGLVYVKSQTIGTAVTAVSVSDAFSDTYDAYRIVVAGGTSSAAISPAMTLGASTTSYYWSLALVNYSDGTTGGLAGNNVASWTIGGGTGPAFAFTVELVNPFLARPTLFRNFDSNTTAQARHFGGIHGASTSYTSFTITAPSGTLTGGTITVYGYRKA